MSTAILVLGEFDPCRDAINGCTSECCASGRVRGKHVSPLDDIHWCHQVAFWSEKYTLNRKNELVLKFVPRTPLGIGGMSCFGVWFLDRKDPSGSLKQSQKKSCNGA